MTNIISKIKTPDNTEYSLKDSYKSGIYTVIGTQTDKTGAWTGDLHGVPALYDGLTINYYLPYDGSGNATLTLTLDDGTTTGAINCYLHTSRLTTHQAAGRSIVMTYQSAGSINIKGTATTDNRWICDAFYDSNDTAYYVRRYYPKIVAGASKIFPYTIIMQNADGRWESIVTSSSTGTSKARNTHGFRLGQLLLMYANATYNENSEIGNTNVWEMHSLFDHRQSFNTANNATSGTETKKPYYLVGSINSSDGLFYLDATWWTKDLPSTEDGKLYIYLGDAYDYYRMSFAGQHPIYHYLNGMIREYTQSATTTVAQRQKDSGNVNFPVLFANDNVGIETDQVNAVFKSKKIYINPEMGNLVTTQLNGTTIPTSPKFTDTTYTAGTGLSLTGTQFSVKTGYTTSGNNRAVQADSNGNLYVTQKDDNTTYTGTGLISVNSSTHVISTTAEANQNAFSNVKVGSSTIAADTKTDTLELVAGDNVTLTPDATNDKVTIAAANDKVTQTYATTGDNAYLLLSGSVSASTTTEGVRKTGFLSQRMSDYKASSYGGWESDATKDGYKKVGLLNHDGLFVTMAPGNDITNINTKIETSYIEWTDSDQNKWPELEMNFTTINPFSEYSTTGSYSSSDINFYSYDPDHHPLYLASLKSEGLTIKEFTNNAGTYLTPLSIQTTKVICDKMSVSSKTDVTFSKTSGVQTSANDAFFRRSGNVVQLNIYFKGNGSSTAVGTTVIEGSFSSNLPAPSEATRLIGYYSSTHFMGTLYTNRTFQLRLLGAAVNIGTSNTVLLSGTYITDET